jgi:hypothetical protein
VSDETVSYVELPGAGHGFDLTGYIRHSERLICTNLGVTPDLAEAVFANSSVAARWPRRIPPERAVEADEVGVAVDETHRRC